MASEFPVPSLPPDAIIPATPSDERIQLVDRASPANDEIERLGEEDILPRGADGGSDEATSAPPPRITLPPRAVREAVATNLSDAVSALSAPPPAPRRSASFALAALAAVATIAILTAVLRYGRAPAARESVVETAAPAPAVAPSPSSVPMVESPASAVPPAAPSKVEATATPSRVPVPAAPSRAEEPTAPSRGATSVGPDVRGAPPPAKSEDDPIPRGVAVGPGEGLLDVETADRASIFVDGVEQARGFFLRIALTPGTHDVRLRGVPDTSGPAETRGLGREQTRQVVVRAGRRTRLLVAPFWTR